jgi:helicase
VNKELNLREITEQLRQTASDPGFDNQRNQLRSKALLNRLSPDMVSTIDYTYKTERLIRNGIFILQNAIRLLESGAELSTLMENLRRTAEIFEYLSSLREGASSNTSAMMAAALYQLAGYEANSLCLAQSIESPVLPREIDAHSATDLLERWVKLALERRFTRLMFETQALENDIQRSQAQFIESLEKGDAHSDALVGLAEAELVTRMFLSFSIFAMRGENTSFESIFQNADDLIELLTRTGQSSQFFAVRLFEAFTRMLGKRSLWTILRDQINVDPVWHRYATLSGRGRAPNLLDARGTIELWQSQRMALEAGLLRAHSSGLVIRMPTSAGKTRIAELAILEHLAREGLRAKAVYVAPYRALSDEVEMNLGGLLGDLGFQVSAILGSFELDELEAQILRRTNLLITTPEKLSLFFRTSPEFFSDVGLVVLDEGQIIDDRERGARYELLLTRLRSIMPQESRILFISAVISEENASEFAAWLCRNADSVATTEWRPARQSLGKFNWTREVGEIVYPRDEPIFGTQPPFVPRVVQQREYHDFTPKLRKEKVTVFPTNSKGELAAELAIKFAVLGPVLIFTTRPDWAESCAEAVQRGLLLRKQTDVTLVPDAFKRASELAASLTSVEVADTWMGPNGLMSKLLSNGIGIHHAALPEAVRRAVEEDFRSGALPVLVATNTLAQGVNMPIKTVIVHSVSRYEPGTGEDEEAQATRVSQRDFWNICGRAGRAGAETEGQVIFVSLNRRDDAVFQEYSQRRYEPMNGRLYEILKELAEGRLSQDKFAEQLDSDLLSVLVEESADVDIILKQLIETSLVGIHAQRNQEPLDPLIDMSRSVATDIRTRISDSEQRKVYMQTGLQITSCEALTSWIESEADQVRSMVTDPDIATEALLKEVFSKVSRLPQMQPQYNFEADREQLLIDWVNQTSIRDLVNSYTYSDTQEMSFHRFVGDYFGYRLPWGISAYIHVAKHVLGIDDELPEKQRWLASMVKYGVPSPRSTWAMCLGCPSRDLASRLASGFATDHGNESFGTFIEWFSSLTEEDFAHRFGATANQARALTRKARSLVPNREELISRIRERPTTIRARIMGMRYEGREQKAIGIAQGETVQLEREYINEYDANAVKVLYKGNHIGYLERAVARLLAPDIDAGLKFQAIVSNVRHEPTLSVTVNLSSLT